MQMMEGAEDTIIYRSLTRDRGQVCKYLHYDDDVAKAASMRILWTTIAPRAVAMASGIHDLRNTSSQISCKNVRSVGIAVGSSRTGNTKY